MASGARAGTKNAYRCEECGGFTVTIHRDKGTTPMFLACRASGDAGSCPGRAASMMYRREPWPEHIPSEPVWEWYRPSPSAIRRRDPAMREHLERGGLELRKIEREAKVAMLPRKERRALERAASKGRKQ